MNLSSLLVIAAATVAVAPAASAQEDLTGQRMPYGAFARLAQTDVKVPGAVLKVAFAPGAMALRKQVVLDWIALSAEAVATYYGRFPVREAKLLIVPVPGRGVLSGTAFAYGGAAIRLAIGRDSGEEDLLRDWKIVHEMTHLALPDVPEDNLWLAEGLAVYLEPIARAQAGHIREEPVWAAMIRDMPQGLPKAGDEGLDRTHSWGRTYWGGAIFALLADVEIRERTQNRFGLQDALRGVLAAGGDHEQDWRVRQVFKVADKAVGVPVLTELYERMRTTPVETDLDALWQRLGVVRKSGRVAFDDNAPLAGIRRAIMRPRPAPQLSN